MTAQSAGLVLPELPPSLDEVSVFMGARSDDHSRFAAPNGEYFSADDMREYGRRCALTAAPAADGVRLEYVINQMPLSEFNTWLGTGLEWDGDKAPTLAQIRDAIDSVMPAAPQAQGEE